jgi:DNA-binding NtrC family response regulator
VRVIAATNSNLRAGIRAGTFREDLFYRLSVIELEVPPLSERREDIVLLARHFLQPGFALTAAAEAALVRHSWPGNVRELQNCIRRACLLSSEAAIGVGALSLPAGPAASPDPELDRTTVEDALQRARGVIAQAARDLGLSRQALYRRMEKLGLKTDAPPSVP